MLMYMQENQFSIILSIFGIGLMIYFHYNPYQESAYTELHESKDNAQQRY